MGDDRAGGPAALKPVIRIDGEMVEVPLEADLAETEPEVYSVISGPNAWEARLSGNEISLGGHSFHFEIEDPRKWKKTSAHAGLDGPIAITAPMPGRIVRLLVEAGAQVKAGEGIVVIEAMKMQNELKSPRDGRVSALQVSENDGVNAGAVLAIID